MTTPPPKKSQDSSETSEDDVAPGASDLLKPSKRDETIVTQHPGGEAEDNKSPRWTDGDGEDSSSAIQRSLMTDPDESIVESVEHREDSTATAIAFEKGGGENPEVVNLLDEGAPTEKNIPISKRETSKFTISDVTTSRTALKGEAPHYSENEPDTERSRPTLPFSGRTQPLDDGSDSAKGEEETVAISDRGTQKIEASEVLPTGKAVDPASGSLQTPSGPDVEDEPETNPIHNNLPDHAYNEPEKPVDESSEPSDASEPIASRETRKLIAADIKPYSSSKKAEAVLEEEKRNKKVLEEDETELEQTKPAIPNPDPRASQVNSHASSRPTTPAQSQSYAEELESAETSSSLESSRTPDETPSLDEPASIEVTLASREPPLLSDNSSYQGSIASQMLVPIPDPLPNERGGRLTPPDPDSTGRLDGLPPFALTEVLEKVTLDPEKTNKFVKGLVHIDGLEEEEHRSSSPEIDTSTSDESSASSQPDASVGGETVEASESSQSAPGEKPSRGRLSPAVLVLTNILSLIFGVAIGGGAVFYGVVDRLDLEALLGTPRALMQQEESEAHQRSQMAAEHAPATAEEATMSFAPDVNGASATSIDTSTDDTVATSLRVGATDLPDEIVLPVNFRPGRHEPMVSDDETLTTIADIITNSDGLRVEIIGHTTETDDMPRLQRPILALQRAEETAALIRGHGPSRRRFEVRGSNDDELLPQTPTAEGLIRPVVLRVIGR